MKLKRLFMVFVAVALILSLAACGGSTGTDKKQGASTVVSSNSTVSPEQPRKEVEISIWNDIADTEGVQNNPIANEIAKITGVRMNVVKGDAEKFKVLQAGGDLPDIVFVNGQLLDTKQLVPLDDLIASKGKDIQKNFPQILDYSRKYLSNDGKIYYLPVHIYTSKPGTSQVGKLGPSVAIFGRWDVYEKIGYPNATNQDEFLNILKKMQDANPKTPEGKKVYALAGWTDWGFWPYYINQFFGNGYTDTSYDLVYNRNTGEIKSIFNSNEFWDGLKFFNKAYNMGILDPESFIMKMDNYDAKVKAGQILTVYANWWADSYNSWFAANGKPDWGFEFINNGLPYVPEVYYAEWPLGWQASYAHAITTNCKNPEKAMELINFLYSEDGAKLVYRGIKGVHWDIVNGTAQMTKEYTDKSAADSNYTAKEGFVYSRLVGYDGGQILSDGATADLKNMPSEIAKSVTPVDTKFSQHYGDFQFPGQAIESLVKNGTIKTPDSKFWLAPALLKEPSDDTKKTLSQVEEYISANISKIIMAKSDADFEAIKRQMLKDMNNKGLDKALQEQAKLIEQAQQAAK